MWIKICNFENYSDARRPNDASSITIYSIINNLSNTFEKTSFLRSNHEDSMDFARLGHAQEAHDDVIKNLSTFSD